MNNPSAPSAAPTSAASALPPFRVLVLPGDGIGREVVPAAVRVLEATGIPFAFEQGEAGWGCFERSGTSLPAETLDAARGADAILFGAVSSPSSPMPGYRSPIVALRRELELYANVRPVVSMTIDDRRPTIEAQTSTIVHRPSSIVDLVVVRENTEDLYMGRERTEDGGDTAIAERVITRRASQRIARAAFELARERLNVRRLKVESSTAQPVTFNLQPANLQPKVTVVHKANVLRETCGLFRAVALEVAAEYPDVATEELLVDNAALQLVQRPERFDVIVTTNMFGDILSDLASYWGGGLGMASSANLGDRQALFEPVHGSAPDIAGKGIANPLAAIGCTALLLDYLGRTTNDERRATAEACRRWAERIRSAIRDTVAGDIRTPDLGGQSTTEEITNTIIAALKRQR
jgi:homoisocitrate dehydrogenase